MASRQSKRGVAIIDVEGLESNPASVSPHKKQRTAKSGGSVRNSTTAVESNTTKPSASRAISGVTGGIVNGDPVTPENRSPRVVTPSQPILVPRAGSKSEEKEGLPLRRALLTSPPVPAAESAKLLTGVDVIEEPKAKKRLAFGKYVLETPCQKNVHETYKIISKLTGSVGGNGSFGAIYGELTMGSMQKMVDLMKTHTAFDSSSRFIDVGSGIGKPNLHVCQDPGVDFSYGIEMERSRWMLGMTNLKAILKAARVQHESGTPSLKEERIGHNCDFGFGNIMDAESFDPFTHVYMFSIGFPPTLFFKLAEMFNKSSSSYLICYHSPGDIIDSYGFNVELIVQAPTSMHGSKEGHMGYIYKRLGAKGNLSNHVACAPFFQDSWNTVSGGIETLTQAVESRMQEACFQDRVTRSCGVQMTALSKEEAKAAVGNKKHSKQR